MGRAVLPAGLNSQYCFESILFFLFLVIFFYFLDNGNWLKENRKEDFPVGKIQENEFIFSAAYLKM